MSRCVAETAGPECAPSARAARLAPPAARSAAALSVLLCGALLSAGLAGCSGASPFAASDLPESADVETAPWPSLVDAPAPISTSGAASPAATAAKGDEIRADVGGEAARLRARVAEMEARPVLTRSLARDVADLRARTRELQSR